MKRILLSLLVAVFTCTGAFAQFEKGTWYLGSSLTGLNLSHSKFQGTAFGIQASAGNFLADNLMLMINFKGDYQKGPDETSVGAQVRYYLSQYGFYGAAGFSYKFLTFEGLHSNTSCVTPEIGYTYYLNHYLAVEPAVYYDLALKNTKDTSKFGLKIGLAIYF